MSDEHKLIRQRELGTQAKQLVEHPLLTQIFEGLKERYTTEWAQTQPKDAKAREDAFFQLRALMDLRQTILLICETGRAAETFLNARQKQAA